MACPKPSQVLRASEDAFRTLSDGRQICSDTRAGRIEYAHRRWVAWKAQKFRCALCHRPLRFEEATSDHIRPRKMGAGERDDRQANIQAVCTRCNGLKGSRRDYR